jgi:hypothetical protein
LLLGELSDLFDSTRSTVLEATEKDDIKESERSNLHLVNVLVNMDSIFTGDELVHGILGLAIASFAVGFLDWRRHFSNLE